MNIYTLHDTLPAPALCNTCGVTTSHLKIYLLCGCVYQQPGKYKDKI